MDTSPPPRRLVEHALLLIGRIHKGDADAAHAAREQLRLWRLAAPLHAQAAQAAQQLWDASDGGALRDGVPLPGRHDPRPRRRAIQLLGVAGLGVLTAGAMRWRWTQPTWEMALRSGHAQLIDQELPDGTQLNLAARTHLKISYFRDRREIHLAQGEVQLAVTSDRQRPLTVSTAWGRVRVLGTVFSVSAHRDGMQVAVTEGRVEVWPAPQLQPAALPLVLEAGGGARSDRTGLGPRQTVAADAVAAWRRGWLVFDDTPLPEVLERWNDYLQRPWQLGPQPALRSLRLSGSFLIRQPQVFLKSLPDMLPVRLSRDAAGATVVGMAE